MWFVVVIAIIVIAGWIWLANRTATGHAGSGWNESAPANAYDNPYDTNENNDRPFEPDACGDASDGSSPDDSGTCDGSDSGSSGD
ncbi:MAG TPA: hypothetical protein VLC71_10285 [Thermomonas sp.]|nr:hypothetical protein [Thermomonas sp.]